MWNPKIPKISKKKTHCDWFQNFVKIQNSFFVKICGEQLTNSLSQFYKFTISLFHEFNISQILQGTLEKLARRNCIWFPGALLTHMRCSLHIFAKQQISIYIHNFTNSQFYEFTILRIHNFTNSQFPKFCREHRRKLARRNCFWCPGAPTQPASRKRCSTPPVLMPSKNVWLESKNIFRYAQYT